MRLEFTKSAQSSIGIEWELGLVDTATGQLANVGKDILAKLEPPQRRTI